MLKHHLPHQDVVNHDPTVAFMHPDQKVMGQTVSTHQQLSKLADSFMEARLCNDPLTKDERDTKSLGGSGRSVGKIESQESDAGVRGLGLQGVGLLPPT